MALTETKIIRAARQRVGNNPDRSIAEQMVPDEAIKAEMLEHIRECNAAFSSSSGLVEFSFTAVSGQQDYPIVATIGPDVRSIEDVVRSDAYVSDSFLDHSQVDPRTGVPTVRAAFIDQGYQQSALDAMIAQERWRHLDTYSWEQINVTGTLMLRLMPPPSGARIISVRYLANGASIATLPDEAESAMVNAACMSLIDCMLNRVNSTPGAADEQSRDRRFWIEMMERQRDRYEAKFRRALARRPGGG